MGSRFGCIFALLALAFGIVQIGAGYVGIENSFGSVWAWVALFLAFAFRFSLPLTVGAFLCAMNVWQWHWVLAAIFAAPGLFFLVPGTIAGILASFQRR